MANDSSWSGGSLSGSAAQDFGNKLRRQGGVPVQQQRSAGMTPWGAPARPHQGRNDFQMGPRQGGNIGRAWTPTPQTGGPDARYPLGGRPQDIIPPGPPGGSYGLPEGRVPRQNDIIPPGPAGQSYGPVEGFNPIPPGPPQGYGPYDPSAKPGQITGAIPQNFGQLFPGASPFAMNFLNRMQIPGGGRNDIIPPGPAGQSYGPVETIKPPVDRSWLRTEGLRRPFMPEEY